MSFVFINMLDSEKRAIASVDEKQLRDRINTAVDNRDPGGLYGLPLEECGAYVSSKFRELRRAIETYRDAKSAHKLECTAQDVHIAAGKLQAAVSEMKELMAEEERNSQFFRIEDRFPHPHSFTNSLSVRISFRWRKAVDADWNFGSIEYRYDYVERVDYSAPQPARKPSAHQVEEKRQAKLREVWENMRERGLLSVRDYFKAGGDGSKIPESFTVKPGDGYLNNFSADFWDRKSPPAM